MKIRFLKGVIIPVWALLAITGIYVDASAKDDSSSSGDDRISVVTTPSRLMNFVDGVETYGNVKSKNFALVSARIPGVIDEIYVDEGDYVNAEETSLFQMDKIKVNQAMMIAKQAVSVAEYTRRAREASVARSEADFEKSKLDYERYKRLYEEDKAVTKNVFELQATRFRQLKAGLDEANANAELSEKQVEQAKSNFVIATKDLQDSLVKAPLTGYVSGRYMEPGEMAAAGTLVLRIDDPTVLEISAFLPAEYYARVIRHKTVMRVSVNQIDVGEIPVTYRSPTIDSRLRNFEIKGLLNKPPEGLASGAMAKIKVVLGREVSLGVPRNALLKRISGDIIFLAEGGKARMVQVKTGLQMDGWVEILSGDLKEGASVITMGQDQLDDGSLISVLREDKD